MRVLVTGGTGFLGRALVRELHRRDDKVTVLTRDPNAARHELPRDVRAARWDPSRPGAWQDEVGVVDAVVHLAGDTVMKRWSAKNKRKMRDSRIKTARMLVEAMAHAKHKPEVFVSASATGYYGNDRSDPVDEDSTPGTGFLAELCQDWEAETAKAEALGVRVVQLRIGVVLGPGGGALSQLIGPMKLFVNGPIGTGANVMSWVHIDDVVGMVTWAMDNPDVRGPINCTAPESTTARELAVTMGSVLGRRHIPAPEPIAKWMLGDAIEVVTGSLEVYPRRAVDLGYEYHHARLLPALEAALVGEA